MERLIAEMIPVLYTVHYKDGMGIDEMNLLYQLKSCLWAMNRHNYPAICREVFDNRNYLNKRDTTFPVFCAYSRQRTAEPDTEKLHYPVSMCDHECNTGYPRMKTSPGQ